MDKPSADDLRRYRALVEEVLAHVDAKDSVMFGMPTLKTQAGKAFCGAVAGGVVFKLTDGAALARARALPGATQLDPAGGRPLKEWVVLGPEHEERWLEFALTAFAGV